MEINFHSQRNMARAIRQGMDTIGIGKMEIDRIGTGNMEIEYGLGTRSNSYTAGPALLCTVIKLLTLSSFCSLQADELDTEPFRVTQYHFIAWPNHGVPKFATSHIAFIRRVQKGHNKNVTVSLCWSTAVGGLDRCFHSAGKDEACL